MSKIRRRQRCPKCGSLDIIRWGYRDSHQRYKCRVCGASFVKHKEGVRQSNRLVWFRKWVLGKQTIEDIAQESGYSTRQLHRWFDEYLDTSPTWIISTSCPIYLLIDGTYYSDDHCLIVYRAENLKRTIFYRFTRLEDDDEIASDLLNIRDMGYDIIGITTDGGDNIIRAVQYVFPRVPRQRCVVHVQRECLLSITQRPRSSEAKLLRNLIQQLSIVQTTNDKLWWLNQYSRWVEDNLEYVLEKATNPYTKQEYYVRNDLRKAYIHLKRALPNLFTFIDSPGTHRAQQRSNRKTQFHAHTRPILNLYISPRWLFVVQFFDSVVQFL